MLLAHFQPQIHHLQTQIINFNPNLPENLQSIVKHFQYSFSHSVENQSLRPSQQSQKMKTPKLIEQTCLSFQTQFAPQKLGFFYCLLQIKYLRMSCGCVPIHFSSLLSPLSRERRHEIRQQVCNFFDDLKKLQLQKEINLVTEADVIFYNGTIYTMQEENATAEAIVISGDKIVFIGSFFEASFFKREKTQMINLKGRTLMPGFIDSHIHLQMEAYKSLTDISPFLFSSEADIHTKVVETVQKATGQWVGFQLYDPMITEGDMPHSKWDLDLISKDKAIVMVEANGHILHVNSKTFELIGIDHKNASAVKQPKFGRYVIDTQKNQLTGECQESAVLQIIGKMPKFTQQQYDANLTDLIARISSKGITTVHDCGVGIINPQIQLNFISKHFGPKCQIRLSGMYVSTLWDYWHTKIKVLPQFQNRQVRLNGIKCLVDGSTQGGSAFLTENYLKSQWGKGFANYDQKQLDQAVLRAHKQGFRVGIHANGDAGIDMALNSFEEARKTGLNPHLRLRIEHSTVCRQDQLDRMYRLGVSPSFLIGHVYFYGKAFRDQILGLKRASKIDPVNSAFKSNLKPTLHSDYSCQPIDPLRCVHNAVTRVLKYGINNEVLGPEQRITVYQAFKTITTNAAWQCHMDDIVGSITVGKLADFVILEEDPFKVDPLDIINIQVSQTWKGGVKRYPSA